LAGACAQSEPPHPVRIERLQMRLDFVVDTPLQRKRIRRFCAYPTLLALSPSLPAAYGQVTATLSGTVTDQSGTRILAANVTANDVDTGAVRSTDADARKPQFAEAARTDVHLLVGQSASTDMQLQHESREDLV
jgi:hypothetical protein